MILQNKEVKTMDENNDDVCCVYWAIIGDFYYVCPEKITLDDCCFKGTMDECYDWIRKHENPEKFKNVNRIRI